MKRFLLFTTLLFCACPGGGMDDAYGGTFDRAVAFVLDHEGGYCHDRGSESNFGICSKWYPRENIKGMTRARAIEIYRADYWTATGADMLTDTVLAFVYFDCAVLFGQPAARAMLIKSGMDARRLLDRRVIAMQKQIKNCPDDVIYLRTWVQRLLDLQLASGLTVEGKAEGVK